MVKPNAGTGGEDVFKVHNEAELETVIQDLFTRHRAVSVSPFIAIEEEYRVMILHGEVQLIYRKQRSAQDWKHNLGKGAVAVIDDLQGREAELAYMARQAAAAIHINFASIDIVSSANGLQVMEINAGVMMEHFARQGAREYAIAKQIYAHALSAMMRDEAGGAQA